MVLDFVPPSICQSLPEFVFHRGKFRTRSCELVTVRVLGYQASWTRFTGLCRSCGVFAAAPTEKQCSACAYIDAHLVALRRSARVSQDAWIARLCALAVTIIGGCWFWANVVHLVGKLFR